MGRAMQNSSVLSLILTAGLAASASAQAPLTSTFASQGAAVPGAPANVFYSIINVADVTNDSNAPSTANGRVIFPTTLTGGGVAAANDLAVVAGPISSPTLLAREGSTAASQPAGVNYSSFLFPRVNNNGVYVFTAGLTGAGVTSANNESIVRGTHGSLTQIAQRGQTAAVAAAPAAIFNDLMQESVRLADNGHVVFYASLTGAGVPSTADRGLWTVDPAGTLTMIARENDPAAGLDPAVLYADFPDTAASETSSATISDAGIAFRATLRSTPALPSTNDSAVYFRSTAGTTSLVMREGDSAVPLFGGTATYGEHTTPSLNASGQIVFRVGLTGAPTATNVAIVQWQGGTLSSVVRKGDAAPGLTGVTQSDFASTNSVQPKINAQGSVVYQATLAGTGVVTANNAAIIVKHPSEPAFIAMRKGAAAPGAAVGTTISTWTSFSVNSAGELLIVATLTGGGTTTATDSAIYAYIPGQGLRLLTREGETVNVGNGDTRAVQTNGFVYASNGTNTRNNSGGDDGLRAVLGNDGTFVYRGFFLDNSSRMLAVDARTFPCTPSDVASGGQQAGYDGELTADDIIVFINAFFAGNLAVADVAGPGQTPGADGDLSADDIIVFINRFFAGC